VRKIMMAVLAVLGLSGCATQEIVQRQAADNCQAVGISEKDPQFATCSQAFKRQYQEDQLNQNYRNLLNAVPNDRRIPHMDIY
jgi:uncharacterized protein YecT (DUF1311 family)